MSAETSLEDLILAASEKELENEEVIERLAERITDADIPKLKEMTSNFEFLIESWDESVVKSDPKAKVCLSLAELSVLDTPNFRNALNDAVRKGLPPYLSSQGVIKAVGARDSGISVRDVSLRLKRLQHIKTGALIYQTESHSWGKVLTLDKVTASMGIGSLGAGSTSSLSFATAIGGPSFFDPSPEMLVAINPDRRNVPGSARFRQVLSKASLTDISESRLRDIAMRIFTPEIMAIDAFATWWAAAASDPVASKAPGLRAPWDARSILELHTLLSQEEASGGVKLSIEATEKLERFNTAMKKTFSQKDIEMLAECIAMLSVSNDGNTLRQVFAPLRGKAPFWPDPESTIDLRNLETWPRISIKHLEGFIRVSTLLYNQDELAHVGVKLPLRCMGLLFDALPDETVSSAIHKNRPISSDILMWLWKNRSKVGNTLVSILDLNTVIEALIQDGMPKEWGVAQRELKKLLFDKAEFQKFLIENADGDVSSIISALQKIPRIRNFQPGEQQSILVKMSRHSPELKHQFEGGEGKKLMVSGSQQGGQQQSVLPQTPITSVASYKRLGKELEDIIKIYMPENVAAITHARGFGDFRENAEYDAAKERRRFLNRRKAELEAIINTVQPTDFKDVKVDGKVVLGSTVKVEASGKVKEYYLVGAWDGDPEQNLISYKTKLGECLLGAKVGDSVDAPESGKLLVKEISPLPSAIRIKLSGDK